MAGIDGVELAALWPSAGEGETAALAAALRAALEEARARWPALRVEPSTFTAFAASRVAEELRLGRTLEQALGELAFADLFLACACEAAVPGAAAAFQAECYPQIAGVLRRFDLGPDLVEDVQQQVYAKLFVATVPGAGRIGRYGGRGSLAAWVRVVAVREAQNLLRGAGRTAAVGDEALAEILVADDDPLEALANARHRELLRRAFRGAFAALEPRERNLLRYRALEGLSVKKLAEMHRVHRMTVTRWLGDIRHRMLRDMRRILEGELDLATEEAASLLRVFEQSAAPSLTSLLEAD
jgi:RNA polymerase sigma-70 factor, ECF subfamily